MDLFFTEPNRSREKAVTRFFRSPAFRFMIRVSFCYALLVFVSAQVLWADPARGQNLETLELTLEFNNDQLTTVLGRLSKLTNLQFAYNRKEISLYRVTLPKANYSVKEILERSLKNTPLNYKQLNRSIVIYSVKEAVPKPGPQAITDETREAIAFKTVRGRVHDEKGQPLPGVTILLKGTQLGTTSNSDGSFVIDVDGDDIVLIFSFVGYLSQEIPVGDRINLESALLVEMRPDEIALGEVVVTALGMNRSTRSLVYATQAVKASDVKEVRDPNNFLNSLQGKISNAFITQSSGGVGSPASITLRGNRSIQGSNNALIVIDGVPIFSNGFDNMSNNINPDDIESINVLKGASAAALYGSQAGNGVIVITTKQGKEGKISVSLNSGLTVESPFSLPFFQNEYGQGSIGQLDPTVGDSWGARMTGQSYTDAWGNQASYTAQPRNVRDFFRTGSNLTNSLSITAGGEKTQGYFSYTNNSVRGIIDNNNWNRHTVNVRLTNKISKILTTDAKVTYYSQDILNKPRTGEGNTPVLAAYQMARNISTDQARNYQRISNLGVVERAPWPSTLGSVYGNPYWAVNNDNLDEARDQIMGFISARLALTSWLSLAGRANLDRTFMTEEQRTYQGTISWANNPGGYYSIASTKMGQQWYDAILSGENNLGKNLSINYNLGAIYQRSTFNQTLGVANGLNVANKFSINFATTPVITSTARDVITQSVFGQVNLSYLNAIYLDASLRNDWDSRLPAPHAYQYYSAGLGAVISDLVPMTSAFDYLKASISYAEVGNGGQFGLLNPSFTYQAGVGQGYLFQRDVFPFPDLKPEIIKSFEAGIETRFLKNRLGLNLTYYRSNSVNQLLTINIPVATGFTSQYINAGNIRNQGLEMTLNARILRETPLKWEADLNLGINRNKIIALRDDMKEVDLGTNSNFGAIPKVRVGESYGDLAAYQWAKDANGNYLVSAEGRPITTQMLGELPGLIGNYNPKATIGLSNSLNYKGASIRLLVDGRLGGVIVSGTEQNIAFSGLTEATVPHREGGWNLGGYARTGEPVNAEITAQQFWQTVTGKRIGTGEFFAYDATNFRIRELSIGYEIPMKAGRFIKSARIAAVARNLAWLYRGKSLLDIPGLGTRRMWMDPDMTVYIGNTLRGVEYGAFPSTRSAGVNLNLTF